MLHYNYGWVHNESRAFQKQETVESKTARYHEEIVFWS